MSRLFSRASGLVTTWLSTFAIFTGTAHCEVFLTNRPFPGIICYGETREPPPTRLFVAKVDLTHPGIRLRVARGGPDPDGDGPWQTTLMRPTRIAAREGMDLVVNGDFFRARGVVDAEGTNSRYRAAVWGAVNGPAASGGLVWSSSTNSRPCLVVTRRGKVNIRTLKRPGPSQVEVIAGNTMLVRDGKVVPQENKVRHPRTAAGLNADRNKLILLVVDGRKPGKAVGMSYDELAEELIRLGCDQALNLDGGGSSVIAVRDAAVGGYDILNEPTDGRERAVANALGVICPRE